MQVLCMAEPQNSKKDETVIYKFGESVESSSLATNQNSVGVNMGSNESLFSKLQEHGFNTQLAPDLGDFNEGEVFNNLGYSSSETQQKGNQGVLQVLRNKNPQAPKPYASVPPGYSDYQNAVKKLNTVNQLSIVKKFASLRTNPRRPKFKLNALPTKFEGEAVEQDNDFTLEGEQSGTTPIEDYLHSEFMKKEFMFFSDEMIVE